MKKVRRWGPQRRRFRPCKAPYTREKRVLASLDAAGELSVLAERMASDQDRPTGKNVLYHQSKRRHRALPRLSGRQNVSPSSPRMNFRTFSDQMNEFLCAKAKYHVKELGM